MRDKIAIVFGLIGLAIMAAVAYAVSLSVNQAREKYLDAELHAQQCVVLEYEPELTADDIYVSQADGVAYYVKHGGERHYVDGNASRAIFASVVAQDSLYSHMYFAVFAAVCFLMLAAYVLICVIERSYSHWR